MTPQLPIAHDDNAEAFSGMNILDTCNEIKHDVERTTPPLDELLDAVSGGRFMDTIFVFLTGHIDESWQGKLFTLSCLIGNGSTWFYLSEDWLKHIEAKNASLRTQGRKEISRYHATDCSTLHKDFEGWSIDEQTEFVLPLLAMVQREPFAIAAQTVHLDELVRYIPHTKSNPKQFAYIVAFWFLMLEIGDILEKSQSHYAQNWRICLIHERCEYDVPLLSAFNEAKGQFHFPHKEHFVSLTPMGWEDCTPLQIADLMAYENGKEAERIHSQAPRVRRRSLEAILRYGNIGGALRGFTPDTLKELKRRIDGMDEASRRTFLRITGAIGPQNEGVQFSDFLTKLLAVPHLEIKKRLDEGKAKKRRKKRSKSFSSHGADAV